MASVDVTVKSTSTGEAEVSSWLKEIEAARKREKDWRKEAQALVQMYEGAKCKADSYNILYANTDTLAPALFNSTPRPIVQRRFKDSDPLGKLAATAAQRALEFMLDTGDNEYPVFEELVSADVLEALVPGRGLSRFKYDAQVEEVAEGEEGAPNVTGERVCGEKMAWNRFLHGYGKRWKDVPWIAFVHYMDQAELDSNFPELKGKISLTTADAGDAVAESDGEQPPKDADLRYAAVYEIWDKTSRSQIFVSDGYTDGVCKKLVDPLEIQGFFPCPEPLTFMPKIGELLPVPLYRLYKEQAEELNTVSQRINRIVRALRIRGFYDNTVAGLDKLLESEDNVLLPLDNAAALFGQGKKLEDAIWIMPLQELAGVLQQLYVQRQQCKTVIYELTGIADIMRGSSQASETLGAQELKNQWGTLRLKKSQKRVMKYVRNALRIMLEIAANKYSEKTWKAMTGLPLLTGEEKMALGQQVQMMQLQPPQNEQQAQQFQQMQQKLQAPGWTEVLQLLRDDTLRNFRIDIETNSTIDAEATEDKQNISELLTALSQFLTGVSPLIDNGTLPFEAAKAMLMAIVRRFRFGSEVEDQLDLMKPPEPKEEKPSPADMIKLEGEKMKQQGEGSKLQMEMQKMQMEMELERERHQLEMEKLNFDRQEAQAAHAMKMAEMQMQAAMPPKVAAKPARNMPA